MARTEARIELVGFLGKDPEIKYHESGKVSCKFSVAHSWKKSDGSEVTDWYSITAWGKTAEAINTYLKKGSHVKVVGDFTSSVWTDQSGNTKISNNVSAKDVLFLDKAGEGSGGGGSSSGGSNPNEPW